MEETAIDELWAKCRANVEHIFKDFRYIEINFTFAKGAVTPDGSMLDPQDGQIEEEKELKRRSPSLMYAKLLTEQDINKIKDKFFEDINNALEEAKRKHVSISPFLTNFDSAQHYSRKHASLDLCAIGLLCLRRYFQNDHESNSFLSNYVCHQYRSYDVLNWTWTSYGSSGQIDCQYGPQSCRSAFLSLNIIIIEFIIIII